jgi:hypothetical protein
MIAPVVYPLSPSDEGYGTSSTIRSDLHVTTERYTEDRQGCFQTLATRSMSEKPLSKMRAYRRQLALQNHLRNIQEELALVSYQPSSTETTLIARYVDMLGSDPAGKRCFDILGTWIQSIPSRIGSNKMLDLAVQFLVDSHATYRDDMYSKRKVARASKNKALKELQLAVMDTNKGTTYDVLLATKLHYAAEVG